MATTKSLLDKIKKQNIQYIDFLFTDIDGVQHHMTYHSDAVDKDVLEKGIMFDGSSITGWKDINESDMIIMPDPSTAQIDPFARELTLNVVCDIYDPADDKPYSRDPRFIAQKALDYAKQTKIADTIYFGPEAEFFIFDEVRFEQNSHFGYYDLDDSESPHDMGREYEDITNSGHRPRTSGGYVPLGPVDHNYDLRCAMVSTLKDYGLKVEKHHHEVAPSQGEIGITYDELKPCADGLQAYKYIVKNVADRYGKTATFMPKPIFGDNGSGMHCHISLWKKGKPLFAGDKYNGLSQDALYFIGGILKHAKALNAFTNPSTNSYKRLVPGYEAPVICAYSAKNRSAACRIPHTTSKNAKRVEIRFPDAMANPYLAFSALLLAGLDGIKNQIDPGKAHDENLYALSPKELSKLPHVAGSLQDALDALKTDHKFLLEGNVFDKDMIENYISMKSEEVDRVRMTPNPVEFDLYYSR